MAERQLEIACLAHAVEFNQHAVLEVEELEPARVQRLQPVQWIARDAELAQVFPAAREHVQVTAPATGDARAFIEGPDARHGAIIRRTGRIRRDAPVFRASITRHPRPRPDDHLLTPGWADATA